MNKVILMGRLTRDPEVRYTQNSIPLAIARYSLAVNKRTKREGEADADFINCVAFGKTGEFSEKYFKKGQMVGIVGRLSVRNWEDQNGQKRVTTEVIVDEQFFGESKSSFETRSAYSSSYSDENQPSNSKNNNNQNNNVSIENDGFYPIEEHIDEDDLPF